MGLIAKLKALYDLYTYVVVPWAIILDGEIKKRQRKKKEAREKRAKEAEGESRQP